MKVTKTMKNRANSYLKKATQNGKHPALGFANKETIEGKEYTVMTDRYSALYLANDYELSMFESLTEKERKQLKANEYPSLQRVTPPKGDIKVKLPTLEELKIHISTTPKVDGFTFIKLERSDNEIVWLDAKRLKTIFEVLGVKQMKATTTGNLKPVRFEVDGEDSFAILCPIRKYE